MLYADPVILGIDPGIRGAMVVYHVASNTVHNAYNIPISVIQRNKKQKHIVNIPALLGLLFDLHKKFPTLHAFIELVGANPMQRRRQGGSSMFSFGRTDGIIETAVVAAAIPFNKVPPGIWKKALQCPADKDASLLRATALIPSGHTAWTPERKKRTKEDCKGVAEAALIAYYGGNVASTVIFAKAA